MMNTMNGERTHWTDCRVSAYGAHFSLSRIARIELVDLMRRHLSTHVELLDQLKNIQHHLRNPGFTVMKQPFDGLAEATTTHIEYLCERIKDFGGMPERVLLASMRAPIQHCAEVPFADGLNNIHSRAQELGSFARQLQPVTQRASRYGDYATATLVSEILAQAQTIIHAIKLNIPASRPNAVPPALYQQTPNLVTHSARR
ncbi:hypothetical protein AUC61_15030 [Pseudomonas sp. S25]|uniref:Ferritin/DPS domain-containing protein n=1 Tax=Pseudomonas maioricensis TaxID=1766623 RepID=A0ABS9ZKS7_9PSED|nr:ferritin-like domain-containing protein [Pseudomonas sp. S25]MCI8210847.1 hypothetical protein [Pseudomonas sp. S25]